MTTQARYQQIYAELMHDIDCGILAGGDKLPSEPQLAARFGVTRQTLLKALRMMKHEGVLSSKQGKGTFVNSQSAFPAAASARQIVFIASNLQESFAYKTLLGIESACEKLKYQLITCNTRNDAEREAEFLRRARAGSTAGVILIPYLQQNRELALRISAELPMVCVDYGFGDGAIPVVSMDHYQASYEAARHLILLGHRRIGFILNSFEAAEKVESIRKRLEGYRQALLDAGIPCDPALVSELGGHLSNMRPCDVGLELYGYPAMNRLLHLPSPPSAVLLLWDELAPGALAAARDTRRRVPRDLSLIGFNDDDICLLMTPRLSTVRQDGETMGATAVRLLAGRIERGEAIAQYTTIPAELIKRATTQIYHNQPTI